MLVFVAPLGSPALRLLRSSAWVRSRVGAAVSARWPSLGVSLSLRGSLLVVRVRGPLAPAAVGPFLRSLRAVFAHAVFSLWPASFPVSAPLGLPLLRAGFRRAPAS